MPQDRYQTVQEVADRLKVSEATVRHWIKGGVLRAIDIGKGWRVSDVDLDDFLRRHETRSRQNGTTTIPIASEIAPIDHPHQQER